MSNRVLVIDIGSNSIKALVAEGDEHNFSSIWSGRRETRISKGITKVPPVLAQNAISAGSQSVRDLLKEASPHGPFKRVHCVATSAVRSAKNSQEFADSIYKTTGLKLDILNGLAEAQGIALGISTDPEVEDAEGTFSLFDLGGGSMELASLNDYSLKMHLSLPLGAVRLTEQFIKDPASPIAEAKIEAIKAHTKELIINSGFRFQPYLVGSGGGAYFAYSLCHPEIPYKRPQLKRLEIESLLFHLSKLTLDKRKEISGMPENRADILPAALATMSAVMEVSGSESFVLSNRNLRYGLALQALRPQ